MNVKLTSDHRVLIVILGIIAMLMPLSMDMYLPSFPAIAADFNTSDGKVQMTISNYLLGFSVGQLVYGPLSDSWGRKSVMLFGLFAFVIAATGCALAQSIEQLILFRLLHGFVAAAGSVVINALMLDLFDKSEFSRMMSLMILVMTIAPLLGPIVGGVIVTWFSWPVIFWLLAAIALMVLFLVIFYIPETLPPERWVKFQLNTVCYNFISLFRHQKVCCYMMVGAFTGAGLFSFLSCGSLVYLNIYGVSPADFGYYFAINIVTMIILTSFNSRFVMRTGPLVMVRLALVLQAVASVGLVASALFELGLIPLVFFVAIYVGSISMIGANIMALILSDYPHIAGTASSLVNAVRFIISAGVVMLLSRMVPEHTDTAQHVTGETGAVYFIEYLMVGSMAACILIALLFFYLGQRSG